MDNGLGIAPPPAKRPGAPATTESMLETRNRSSERSPPSPKPEASTRRVSSPAKFAKRAEGAMTQFNKRVPQQTADTYAILAVKTGKKVPELLTEASELLQEKYGKV